MGEELTDAEWKELETEGPETVHGKELLQRTWTEDEHPEWFEGPCFCALCLSYADPE